MAYVIFTDSGCDLDLDVLAKWNVRSESLTFKFDGEDKQYRNEDMDVKTFYDRMRKGDVSRTSAVNMDAFYQAFEEELAKGNDILYIGFSSGISTTSNSGIMAASELQEKYPQRKIYAFDTKCASCGQGILVWNAVEARDAGASLEDVARLVETSAPNIGHWFTPSDLVYLKRGGRVSAASAIAGTVLDIKPVMHVDEEGKLVAVKKIRTRKKALQELVAAYETTAIDKGGKFTIGHSDCLPEAEAMAAELKEKYGANGLITNIGPVIGSHTGPGLIVLCFPATHR